MKNASGLEMTCQEEVALGGLNTDCGKPAVVIVDNGDSQPYWMCLGCANHNKSNRGAIVYFAKERQSKPEPPLLRDVREGQAPKERST